MQNVTNRQHSKNHVSEITQCHFVDDSGDIDQIIDYMTVLCSCLEHKSNKEELICSACKAPYIIHANYLGINLYCKCHKALSIGYEDIVLDDNIPIMDVYYLVGTIEYYKNKIQVKFCSKHPIDPFEYTYTQQKGKINKIGFSAEISVQVQQYIRYSHGIQRDKNIFVLLILQEDSLIYLDGLTCQQNGVILVKYDNDNQEDPQQRDIMTLFFQTKMNIEY